MRYSTWHSGGTAESLGLNMQSKPTIILRRTGPNSAAVEYRSIRSPDAAELPAMGSKAAPDGAQASEIRPEMREVSLPTKEDFIPNTDPLIDELGIKSIIPSHWSKGALLNVRNRGDYYVITLYPEEEDARHPERAMRFSNTWTCQEFVSKWYAREAPDPRAR